MLNLRQFGDGEDLTGISQSGRVPQESLRFRLPISTLGNIGEPLEHGEDFEDWDLNEGDSDDPQINTSIQE